MQNYLAQLTETILQPSLPYHNIATMADIEKPKGAKATKSKSNPKSAKLYKRPRGGNARAISDLMPDIGRAAFRRFGFVQSSVVTRWGEIVGEKYAAISCPETIRFPMGQKSGGILELTVEGAHATLMQHVIPEIIERVNRFFGYGAVNRVKIRQGHVPKSEAPKTKAPPNLRPIPLELGENLRDIADPELHAVLESLAQTLANRDEDSGGK